MAAKSPAPNKKKAKTKTAKKAGRSLPEFPGLPRGSVHSPSSFSLSLRRTLEGGLFKRAQFREGAHTAHANHRSKTIYRIIIGVCAFDLRGPPKSHLAEKIANFDPLKTVLKIIYGLREENLQD